jgi:hypothetical protein
MDAISATGLCRPPGMAPVGSCAARGPGFPCQHHSSRARMDRAQQYPCILRCCYEVLGAVAAPDQTPHSAGCIMCVKFEWNSSPQAPYGSAVLIKQPCVACIPHVPFK